jgi:hypothetical protein
MRQGLKHQSVCPSQLYWENIAHRSTRNLPETNEEVEEAEQDTPATPAIEIEVEGLSEDELEEQEFDESESEEQEQDYNSEIESETEEPKQQVSFATMPPKKASIASPPSSAMKKKAPTRKLATITGDIGAPIANGIAAPIIKGAFLSRDPITRKRFNNYHIRMLWHSFVTADDILYEWIDNHTLKVVVYDPAWWSNPAYQAAFDTDHGKDSNLIESMIDFQED